MLKIVKFGSATIGAGLLIGMGAVAWLQYGPDATPVASSSGGSVALDAQSSADKADEQATPTPIALSVRPGDAGSTQTQVIGGGSSSSQSSSSSNSSGGSSDQNKLPGPEEFGQYSVYADKTSAYFGDIVTGTGGEFLTGCLAAVQYKGWLTDGKLFDESKPGKPFVFRLGEHKVIQGWEQSLEHMKVGGKRRLIVPPAVGYGSAGQGSIPPNALLVFDVELAEIKCD